MKILCPVKYFKPALKQSSKPMIRPISKRADPVLYGFINNPNSLVHRTKASLVSALIPLLPHIVNTSLEHQFEQDLIHKLKIIINNKLQSKRPVWINPSATQSTC